MKPVNIAIRADGSAQIGMGHIMRCLSIAMALKEYNAQVIFITNNAQSRSFILEQGFTCLQVTAQDTMDDELEETFSILQEQAINLLLVDSYLATEHYLKQLNAVVPVFYMDDLGRMGLSVSGLINYNIYGHKMSYQEDYPTSTKLLLGSQYAPVKSSFRNTPYEVQGKVSNILITMGGSDSLNIAGQLGTLLADTLSEDISLTLICGKFSPHFAKVQELALHNPRVQVLTNVSDMWNVMKQCDLAIAAAGSTMYELCTMGVPTICCYYVENQRRMAECFGKETSMLNAGDFSKEPEQVLCSIAEHTQKLISSELMRRSLSEEMKVVSDGMGAWRIGKELCEFCDSFREF